MNSSRTVTSKFRLVPQQICPHMSSLQWWEGAERKGDGGQGWVEQVGVTEGCDLNRSWVPSGRSREETSDTDREKDSASPSTGWRWWIETPPDQTTDGAVQRRCHSVQTHTNGDSRPFLPSSLHTSRGAESESRPLQTQLFWIVW